MNPLPPRPRMPIARLVGLTTAAALALAPGLLGLDAAHADPPAHAAAHGHAAKDGRGHGHGNGDGNGHGNGHAHQGGHGRNDDHRHGPQTGGQPGQHPGHQSGHQPGAQPGSSAGSGPQPATPPAQGDPAGNNGTVKIEGVGDLDGVPDNTPHPGCSFVIEWYGFDEGADVVSTVTFAMQAPTADVVLGVDGPSEVFVGGDPASGAGTETGLGGRETYTLSFDGAPQPQQGYHVRLTVSTPRSLGNDTKTKVFWVEPCTPTGSGEVPAPTPTPTPTPVPQTGTDTDTDEALGVTPPSAAMLGMGLQVPGARTVAGAAAPASPPAAVPDAVDAGEGGQVVSDLTSPSGLSTLLVVVLAAGGAGAALRRLRG